MRAIGFFRRPNDNSPAAASYDPLADIQSYCERNYHQLIATHAIGGGVSTEQAYASVADSFRAGRPALVIIPDASHLAEDLETFVGRMVELVELGGEVRCTDADRPDPLQSAEELLSLKGRSAVRQRRVRDAILAKASRGQVLGRTPYGYQAGANGQLKIVPEEAELVKRVFELYAEPSDAHGERSRGGAGLRVIARSLNEAGHRTRQGHPWTPVAIAGILRNRAYLGTYSRYGVRIVGSHTPIIGRELFNLAEEVTESRRPVRKRRSPEPFLLSGLLRSAISGRSMFGLTRKRAWTRQDGTPMEKTYRYYEAPQREPAPDGSGKQVKLSWPAERLEEKVREKVASWPASRFEDAVLVGPDGGLGPEESVRLAEREFSRAVRAVADGYGDIADLKEPLLDLRAARSAADQPPDIEMDSETIKEMALSPEMEVARPALAAVIERISVAPRSIEVFPRLG